MLKISEADWQRTLIDLLKLYGYRVCEFRKARVKKDGQDVYRTPFGAEGKGMTDLIAVREEYVSRSLTLPSRRGRIIFIEDKSETGKLSPDQILWKEAIEAAGGEYYLARPSDYDRLTKELR